MTEPTTGPLQIRRLVPSDRDRASQFIAARWGDDVMVVHGTVYQPSALPGFVALRDDEWCGLVTYHVEGTQFEIVSLDSVYPNLGIGSDLLQAVRAAAIQAGCARLWLVTTNDNLNALRFYQKRGFALAALHRNALEKARVLKPSIPLIGLEGIPLRDEIELESFLP